METRFWKGHGTGNDFVIVERPAPLTPGEVRWLCDRRFGIGGDGTLQALRVGEVAEEIGWRGDPDLWFMDYRNADGSVAEMCGNGLRVFARHLAATGRFTGNRAEVVTRAGLRHVELHEDGRVSVTMGVVRVSAAGVVVEHDGRQWPASKVDVGNPHAVVITDHDTVTGLDLTREPIWHPVEAFPAGVNVEFVEEIDPTTVAMRVHERGSGETLSCGTGTVAVAATMAVRTGRPGPWTVRVRGGEVVVTLTAPDDAPDGSACPGDRELLARDAVLTGPAVILARGEVDLPGVGPSAS